MHHGVLELCCYVFCVLVQWVFTKWKREICTSGEKNPLVDATTIKHPPSGRHDRYLILQNGANRF